MKFSVIIPLYNKAPYVEKAIGSVLSQTFTDYELVIMDDGSKDDSYNVASIVIEGHLNCHLYKQENAGVSMARNNAVALSHGVFVCFLDADDWWEPTFLEEVSKLIEEFPDAGIFGTNYTIVNETNHRTRVASVGVEDGFVKGYVNYCRVYAKTMYMPLTSITVAIPRMIFDELGGFPQGVKLGEDFIFWIHIALKYKVAFLNKPLAYYNQDVDVANRGTNHLHNPKEHMLWNVGFLENEEQNNPDYKRLIDNLRTYSLLPYYLSTDYREVARQELRKVDWKKQPKKTVLLYKQPVALLKFRQEIKKIGSKLKQMIKHFL